MSLSASSATDLTLAFSPSSGGSSRTNAIAALNPPVACQRGQDREGLGRAGGIGVMWVATEKRANVCGPTVPLVVIANTPAWLDGSAAGIPCRREALLLSGSDRTTALGSHSVSPGDGAPLLFDLSLEQGFHSDRSRLSVSRPRALSISLFLRDWAASDFREE